MLGTTHLLRRSAHKLLEYFCVPEAFSKKTTRSPHYAEEERLTSTYVSKKIVLLITVIAIVFLQSVPAQTDRNPQNSVDFASRSSLTVDPITNALKLQIPLGSYKQRNGELPIALNYSSKVWQIKKSTAHSISCYDFTPYYFYNAVYSQTSGWSSTVGGIGVGPGFDYYDTNQQPSMSGITNTVARMYVSLPDGSSHELRRDDTVYSGTVSSFSGKYYSVDSSRLIYDTSNSTLYLPDGSHYTTGTLTDSQGNTIVYSTTPSITDTLGRAISGPLSVSAGEGATADADSTYSIPGFGSGSINYQMHWRKLSDTGIISSDEADQTLRYKSDATGSCSPMLYDVSSLFPSDDLDQELIKRSSTVFNPVVLSQIELPNGQTYTFKYNIYGEIVKIIYPTGGYERFEYAQVAGISGWFDNPFFAQANRGVIHRWVSSDGTSAGEVEYSYGGGTVTNPDGSSTQYVYNSRPSGEILSYGFDNPLYGKITEVRQYSSASDLMSRELTEWMVDGSVVTSSGKVAYKTRDPRVVHEVSIAFEPGSTNALASMTTTDYDSNSDPDYFAKLNVKRKKTYDYVVVAASTAASASLSTAIGWFSSASPAVVHEFDYLYDTNYKARNMNSLVTEARVQDASGNVKAKTHFYYDEVSSYPIISAGTNPQWTDPSTNYRGHPTTVRSWHDIAGNHYIDTHAQYDNFGNLRKTWDGNGNLTQTDYSSTYQYAYPTSVTTPIPDASGTYGSSTAFTSSTAYDSNTGLQTSTTDINGQTTSISYADPSTSVLDPLLRVRKVTAPNGQQTITEYGDTPGSLYVKTSVQLDSTPNWRVSYKYLDNMARVVRTRQVDNSGDDYTLVCYDSMGRASKITNPFRGYSAQTCSTTSGLDWVSTVYDALGRVTSITTPDTAHVDTTYSLADSGSQIGTTVTVTDQAGKVRRSVTNALGQPVRVDEPTTSGLGTVSSPNQATTYAYDYLNNLTGVTQASQSRSFSYDALSRLTSVTNPESGTISYAYDANGNLYQKTDARSITTTYTYDALNRVTRRSYNDTPTATPTVTYYYDNITNGAGKLQKVTSSVSTTEYTSFDISGRVTGHKQTTSSTDYTTTYTYDLAGDLISETYPSGRIVQNTIATDGTLSQVQYKPSGGSYANRASSFAYSPAGSVSSLQLGNGLYEATSFNNRLQPTEIKLGTTSGAYDKLRLQYSYETSGNHDNNGNLLTQTISVPTLTDFVQTYSYDELNRLSLATEMYGSTQNWKQEFSYDRYGNRSFVTGSGHTDTLGSCTTMCNPTFSSTTNRITSTGYTFDTSGNMTTDPSGLSLSYDGENRQTSVSNGPVVGTYYYDGDEKRVKKTSASDSSIFVYDAADRLVEEYPTANPTTVASSYVYAGPRLVSVEMSSGANYLTADHLGSPRINTNNFGSVISRHDYMPFGEEISTAQRSGTLGYGPDGVRKQFTGYVRDSESSLDFAEARTMSFSRGRFTAPDEIGTDQTPTSPQSWNLYAYVTNNPLAFIDPTGMAHVDLKGYYVGDKDGECDKQINACWNEKEHHWDFIGSRPTDIHTSDFIQIAQFQNPLVPADSGPCEAQAPATSSKANSASPKRTCSLVKETAQCLARCAQDARPDLAAKQLGDWLGGPNLGDFLEGMTWTGTAAAAGNQLLNLGFAAKPEWAARASGNAYSSWQHKLLGRSGIGGQVGGKTGTLIGRFGKGLGRVSAYVSGGLLALEGGFASGAFSTCAALCPQRAADNYARCLYK